MDTTASRPTPAGPLHLHGEPAPGPDEDPSLFEAPGVRIELTGDPVADTVAHWCEVCTRNL